eukprot:13951514-Alexandrium_andersonii.AAC.1
MSVGGLPLIAQVPGARRARCCRCAGTVVAVAPQQPLRSDPAKLDVADGCTLRRGARRAVFRRLWPANAD